MEASSRNVAQSFYEQLRSRDDDIEDGRMQALDEENLRHEFRDVQVDDMNTGERRISMGGDMAGYALKNGPSSSKEQYKSNQPTTVWAADDEDVDEDVPASLLVENNSEPIQRLDAMAGAAAQGALDPTPWRPPSPETHRTQWETVKRQQRLYRDDGNPSSQPHSVMVGTRIGGRRERALWRWVNTSSLDTFMRDVYDYYEGGGMWCILCSNALWLL